MGLMRKRAIDLEEFAKGGYSGSVKLSKKLFGWDARNDYGDEGITLSSREVAELKQIMAGMDRVLEITVSGRAGTLQQVFREGKPLSRYGSPCEGFKEMRSGEERIRPGSAKWERDGEYVSPAIFGTTDVQDALSGLAAQDAATGVDKLEDPKWRHLLSGASEVSVYDPVSREAALGSVAVKAPGGKEVVVGRMTQDEIFELKRVTAQLSLAMIVKPCATYSYANRTYRKGSLVRDLWPENHEVLPKEIAEICQGAKRISLLTRKGDHTGGPLMITIEAFNAEGDAIGRSYMPYSEANCQRIRESLRQTSLLVQDMIEGRRDYFQGGEMFDLEEMVFRYNALKSGPAPAEPTLK